MRPCKQCGGPIPCKPCRAAYKQAWAEQNRERMNAHSRAYAERNREKSRASKKAYELRFPERVKESKDKNYSANGAEYKRRERQRRAADRPGYNAKTRAKYAADPTPFIVRLKRRKDRDTQVGGAFTVEYRSALFQIQKGLCANPYCLRDLGESGFHADHKIPVVRGGSHDAMNRQLLCPTCNHRKGTMTNEEWTVKQEKERQAQA